MDDEAESSDFLGEPRCVTGRRAVGDDGAAAREGLETGDSARRVDDDVCGREQLAHAVGEAENGEARLAAEGVLELYAPLRGPSGQADDVSAFELQRGANCAFEISHRPAAARDEGDRPVARKAERAARLGFRAGNEELVGDERRDRPGAPATGDALDLGHEAVVHHEVQIDAAARPELEPGEVRDRRADRGPAPCPAGAVDRAGSSPPATSRR